MRTDRQDVTELTVAFRNLANAPKNVKENRPFVSHKVIGEWWYSPTHSSIRR